MSVFRWKDKIFDGSNTKYKLLSKLTNRSKKLILESSEGEQTSVFFCNDDSYNLIPYPYYDKSKTQNGITFTVNDDGSVVANGTCTDTTIFYINYHKNVIVEGKKYALSGCPSGGGSNKYKVDIINGNVYIATDYGNGIEFVAPSVYSSIRIVIYSGIVANNLTFKPMLVEVDEDGNYPTDYVRNYKSNKELSDAVGYTTLKTTDKTLAGAINEVKAMAESGGMSLDTEMSDTSVNGVQNKVIKSYIDNHTVAMDTEMSDESVNGVQNKVIKTYVDNAEQRNGKSYNLIHYPYSYGTRIVNGVAFTVNTDGSVMANGTATARCLFYLKQKFINNTETNVFMSGCPKGGSATTYRLQVWDETAKISANDYGSGVSVNLLKGNEIAYVIIIESGKTVSNLTFYPMIVEVDENGSYPTKYMRGSVKSNLELTEEIINKVDKSYVDTNLGNYLKKTDKFDHHSKNLIVFPYDGYTTDEDVLDFYADGGIRINNNSSKSAELGVTVSAFDGSEPYMLTCFVYKNEQGLISPYLGNLDDYSIEITGRTQIASAPFTVSTSVPNRTAFILPENMAVCTNIKLIKNEPQSNNGMIIIPDGSEYILYPMLVGTNGNLDMEPPEEFELYFGSNLDLTVRVQDAIDYCASLQQNKVDKVSGKGLSTNDFTAALKTKLDGIAEGANKTIVDTALSSSSTNPVQNKVVNTALGNKVNTSDPIVTSNIKFKDSKRTIEAIRFVANDENTNGEGIVIGAGGFTCIGGGESAKTIMDDTSIMTASDVERMVIANDNYVDVYTNCNNGTDSAKHARFESNGNLTLEGNILATNITTMQNKLNAIGTVYTNSPSANISTANQTAKSVASLKLPAGTYIVTGQVRWAAGSGQRLAGFSTTADTISRNFQVDAAGTSYTAVTCTQIFTYTKETTLYLNAYQNSGGSINVLSAGTEMNAVRIA